MSRCGDPNISRRLGELLDGNPRLCELIEMVGLFCSQPWWRERHLEKFEKDLAKLVPPCGNADYDDYELICDYVRQMIARRRLDASTGPCCDEPNGHDPDIDF